MRLGGSDGSEVRLKMGEGRESKWETTELRATGGRSIADKMTLIDENEAKMAIDR